MLEIETRNQQVQSCLNREIASATQKAIFFPKTNPFLVSSLALDTYILMRWVIQI
jgi:hypothetical protein